MEQKEKDVNTLSIKSPHSDDDSEISEEIDEESINDTGRESADPFFMDSMGASSMGVDASVNSVTLEGYDHVESVSRAK